MKPRCLMLSWEYPPLIEGGLARHIKKLSDALGACGVEVHVLTRADEEPAGEVEVADGLVVHRVRQPRRPCELGPFIAWVERMNADLLAAGVELGDRYHFDLVHGHDWLVAVAADHLAARFRAPLAMTIHATEHGRHQGFVSAQPQAHIHAVERWIVGRADALITCSHYMRAHVADVFGREEARIEVIANGVDPGELRARPDGGELRAAFAAADEQLVLLVGRLVYEKGFQLALDALARLGRSMPGVRFVVAGSGPYEAALREQAGELGLLERGRFLGWIGDEALHGLYSACDVCVVPSIYEPFGLVALEAMAAGCPCIVADTGGLREVVPNDAVGLRFEPRDPDALAALLGTLLGDAALRERLVAQASEHVLNFDWNEIAARTAAVYRELLTGAGRVHSQSKRS